MLPEELAEQYLIHFKGEHGYTEARMART